MPEGSHHEAHPGASRGQLAWLAMLYAVQGLPFGFQASALGAYLRERGFDLSSIGFAGALSLPWLLKVLWAPLVDVHRGGPLGPRRSWIVPMQLALGAAMIVTASLPVDGAVHPLLFLVFLMNLFAATMDIAVDGLAVDLLRPHQLGLGNSIQVVGYKVGMLLGGGLLVWASQFLGWAALFGCMAGLTLAAMMVTLALHEPGPGHTRVARDAAAPPARREFRDVAAELLATLRRPGAIALLLLVMTYKLGESLIDPMFAPMLVDHGVARPVIGLWVGTYGMATSIAGSVLAGLIAARFSLVSTLVFAGALRSVPLVLQVLIAFEHVGVSIAPYAIAVEHFFGGMLSTAMFAFMMSRIDRTIGASHYTLLATAEVLGKSPPALLSGVLADAIGYGPAFSIGLVASLLWPLAAAPLAARAPPAA